MQLLKKSRTGRTTEYFLIFLYKHYRVATVINYLFTPIAIFLGETLVGFYMGKLFQRLVEYKKGENTHAVYHLAIVIIALFVGQIIFYRINDYVGQWRRAKALRNLEQHIFSKLSDYSYRFFAETYGGALVSQVNRFLQACEQFDSVFTYNYLECFSRIVLSAGILFFIAPPLGILLALWSPVFVFTVVYASVKKAHLTRAASAADSRVIANLSDSITNMVTIKTFARAKMENGRFNNVSDDRFKKRLKSWRINALIRDVRWMVALSFFIAYLFLSIHLVVSGSVSPSVIVSGQIYVFGILASLLTLHNVIQTTEQLYGDAAELTDILHTPLELEDPSRPEELRITHGSVTLAAVTFVYPGTTKKVFDNLSLEIPAGQKVGLVGHSGSGKSTLTRLLLRFLDVDAGSILIDGQDITRLTQDDLRSSIAFVPQEPLLFHRTLNDNIGYGRENVTEEEIQQAAWSAYADEFITQLPETYGTLVGERGVKLSGGEKQRVAIARTMLTECPLLILDEATSALDSKSEKLIAKALDELMKDRTAIVIAHRLSTIRKLDRIIVLKDGVIIEDGTHDELLALNGEYTELWTHQSGNFLES